MSSTRKFLPSNSSPLSAQQESPAIPLSPGKKRPLETVLEEDESSKRQATEPPTPENAEDTNLPPMMIERLMTFSLFKNAPRQFYVAVARKLKLMVIHNQQFIVRAGEPAKAMYWILRGTVAVTSPDGETVHAELHEGSYFGEIGILFNRPRTATVVAKTRVLLGVLTADSFNAVLPSFPQIERAIRDEAQERLAMQDKKRAAGVTSLIAGLKSHDRSHPNVTGVHISRKETLLPEGLDNIDDSISTRQFLKSLPLFTTLPASIVHRLAMCTEIKQMDPFQYVFRKGDQGTEIYFVVSGELEVVVRDDNKETVLATLGPGQYFGEMGFLSSMEEVQSERSADIRTVTNVTMLLLTGDTLKDFCQQHPEIRAQITKTASDRKSNNEHANDDVQTPQEHVSRILQSITPFDDAVAPDQELEPLPLPAPRSLKSSSQLMDTLSTFSFGGRSKTPPILLNVPHMPSNTGMFQPPTSNFSFVSHTRRKRLGSVSSHIPRRASMLGVGPIPDRMLLLIFRFLSLPELMKLRLVCRRWRQLLYVAPGLFDKLDLTKWSSSIDDRALQSITDFVGSRPKWIDISNCFHITDGGFSYMLNEIGIGGSLKVLKMASAWEVSSMAIMDIAVPSIGRFLEEIDLTNCKKVNDDVIKRLLGDEASVSSFYEGLPGMEVGCRILKKLVLRYCKQLTDMSLYNMAAHAASRIEELDLTRCTSLTDSGFSYWTYRPFLNLKKLVLADCIFLTDRTVVFLCSSATNLEELNLSFCCTLTDAAVESLCMNMTHLRQLDLSFCGRAVSDASVYSISRHMRSLESLKVKGCLRITRSGVDSLLTGVAPIRYLDIGQCKNAHIYQCGTPAAPFGTETAQNSRSVYISTPHQNKVEVVL